MDAPCFQYYTESSRSGRGYSIPRIAGGERRGPIPWATRTGALLGRRSSGGGGDGCPRLWPKGGRRAGGGRAMGGGGQARGKAGGRGGYLTSYPIDLLPLSIACNPGMARKLPLRPSVHSPSRFAPTEATSGSLPACCTTSSVHLPLLIIIIYFPSSHCRSKVSHSQSQSRWPEWRSNPQPSAHEADVLPLHCPADAASMIK